MVKKDIHKLLIPNPINNLSLFGYNKYFNSFLKLFENKNLPNSIMLSGLKGIGKATFIYHFVNYILSKNEKNKYDLKNFKIDKESDNLKLLKNNIHPNFFLLENENFSNEIKIEQVRKLQQFLNTSTYLKDIKIILIDNAEFLNKNSINSLLKSIEEPTHNTFFFIIQNSTSKISETLKSRCVNFKINFTLEEKKKIFKNIYSNLFTENISEDLIDNFLLIDTPGNVIKYILDLSESQSKNDLNYIYKYINKYKDDKSSETLSFLLLFINNYYKSLLLNKKNNLNVYYNSHSKIIRYICDLKNFNLNSKSVLNSIQFILENEAK